MIAGTLKSICFLLCCGNYLLGITNDVSQTFFREKSCVDNSTCNITVTRNATVADCSNRNLTKVPNLCLAKHVTHLNLSHNNFISLHNNSFENFTELEVLDFSHNERFQELDRDAFRGLNKLYSLDLTALRERPDMSSYCNITPTYIPNGTLSVLPKLRVLRLDYWTGHTMDHLKNFREVICDLNQTDIQEIYANGINMINVVWVMSPPLFDCLSGKRMKKLQMRKNFIASVDDQVLYNLRHLEYLDLSKNIIIGGNKSLIVFDLYQMVDLKHLDISYQNYIKFNANKYPELGDDENHMRHLYPPLRKTNGVQRTNSITDQPSKCSRLPLKLQTLNTSHRNSIVHGFLLHDVCISGNNTLKVLNIAHNWLEKSVFGPVLNFPYLKVLNFQGSRNVFTDPKMFRNLHRLRQLNLRSCDIQELINFENNSRIWDEIIENSKLKKLRKLIMGNNGLTMIPNNLFQYLPELRYVYLDRNILTNISFNLTHLKKLSLIDFSSNKISFLPSDLLKLWPNNTNLIVDLSNNDLITQSCSDILPLRLLSLAEIQLNINIELPLNFKGRIRSCSKSSKPISECYYEALDWCCADYPWKIGVALYIIAIVLTIISVSINPLRWRLIYLYEYAKLILFRKEQYARENCRTEFDAFVCYSHFDYRWIVQQLHPVLETQHGYKLCIHERDFRPGAPIDVNILQSFCVSKSAIFVISRNSLRSTLLNFELHIAREHRLNVICILLEDYRFLSRDMLPPILQYFMDTMTYIKWPKDKFQQKVFWTRLMKALGRPCENDDELDSFP